MTWNKVLQKIMGEKMIKIQTQVIYGVTPEGNASLKEDQDWIAKRTFWGYSVPTMGKFQSFLKKLSDTWTLLFKLSPVLDSLTPVWESFFEPSLCTAVTFPRSRNNRRVCIWRLGGGGRQRWRKTTLKQKGDRIGRQSVGTKLFSPVTPRSWSCAFPVTFMVNFHSINHMEPFHYYVTSQIKTESISLWNGPNTEAQKR